MQLYDYQQEIVEKAIPILKESGIVYLALYQRTGKTPISLTIAKESGADKVLFVTKKKAISSIEDDFHKLGYSFSLRIINYESLHKIKEKYDLVIVDEAHSGISGFPKPSKSYKLLRNIAYDSKIIFLSGTPTPESYSQLFHQLNVSKHSPFANYTSFYKWAKDYVDVVQERRGLYMVNNYSNAKKDLIDEKTKHLFLTKTQEEAGFQCIIDEEFLDVRMKPETKKLMRDLVSDRIIIVDDNEIVADTPVKLSQKLHQISGGTIKLEDGGYLILDNSKAIAIRDRFFNTNKIVVFYKFIAEHEMLKHVFYNNYTSCPDEFRDTDKKVFLAQYVSGREGINLSSADDIIFYNLDFSAVSYFQARERVSTKQKQHATRLWWIFSDTGFEKKVHKALSSKKDFTISHYLKDMS